MESLGTRATMVVTGVPSSPAETPQAALRGEAAAIHLATATHVVPMSDEPNPRPDRPARKTKQSSTTPSRTVEGEPEYEFHIKRVMRGREASTKATMQRQGWEFVTQSEGHPARRRHSTATQCRRQGVRRPPLRPVVRRHSALGQRSRVVRSPAALSRSSSTVLRGGVSVFCTKG